MEWERIAEDDETKGDEWEEDSYGNPFRLPPADVHHDVALQIERQEFIQRGVGVRPSRLT